MESISADDIDAYKDERIALGRRSNRTVVRHPTVLHGISETRGARVEARPDCHRHRHRHPANAVFVADEHRGPVRSTAATSRESDGSAET